jgi:hypothetical protein
LLDLRRDQPGFQNLAGLFFYVHPSAMFVDALWTPQFYARRHMESGTPQAAAEQADYHAFMVRVWRGPAGWQGEIYSLEGADTLAFESLPELLRRLAASLALHHQPPAPPTDE